MSKKAAPVSYTIDRSFRVTKSFDNHISSLQSLRGIASLVVLLRHYVLCFPVSSSFWLTLEGIFLNSHAAVVVFFVLSGFVLSPSFFKKPAGIKEIAGFYTRRIFRILPLLMVVTTLSLIYVKSHFSERNVPFLNAWFQGLLNHDMPLSGFTISKCFLGLNSALVPQNWTIACEIMVAIVLPLFIKACSGRVWMAVLTAASFTGLSFLMIGGSGKTLPIFYAIDFIIGIITFRVLKSHKKTYPDVFFYLAVIGLLGAREVLGILTHRGEIPFHDPLCSLIEALFSAIIIYGLATKNHMSRILSCRGLSQIGDISFGIYLFHFLVIVVVARLMAPLLLSRPLSVQMSGMLIPVLIISFISAYFCFHFIEMPANRLGRTLQKYIQ
ncbi:acyltransferase family protein [Gluconobacter aidae]|uniref:Acyltransferase family protein n=1 Tax=Gluconobacter aidae TaxID=2662454 RepID=A0A7X1SRG9_9PROT|nr:acyltransferase [Gluconobacter aidae]MQR99857.1 acyltransferase family protein [Gluconobacter aidae]